MRVGDPQAASVALSDAVRPDAALPDAAACCDAPPPFPGHSPCPRAAAARARHHRTIYTATAFSRPSHASPPRLVDAGSTASCVRRLCGVFVVTVWGHACTVTVLWLACTCDVTFRYSDVCVVVLAKCHYFNTVMASKK